MTVWTGLELSWDVRDISALVDSILPRDAFPSAADAGGLGFLEHHFTKDSPSDLSRVQSLLGRIREASTDDFAALPAETRDAVLDSFTSDPDFRWFARLVADGFYADPANGGNRDAVSWRMLGYDPYPAGGWPTTAAGPSGGGRITPAELAERYDVIVVGSGAGGGTAACVLAEAGRRVLLVERGDWPAAEELWSDHLRNPRADAGFDVLSGPPSSGNPRVLAGARDVTLYPNDSRWGNNAMTAGGGTRVYGAQAWRFVPTDFRMASTYGVPDGSALADWPISYDDLEPFYSRAEHDLGVCGLSPVDRWAGARSVDYPMPPFAPTLASTVLSRGATALGINTGPIPLLVNTEAYGGRSACVRCGACVGFACPVEAKSGSHNTVIARALATGRCDLLLGSRVERLATDQSGRVIGVALAGLSGGSVWRREVLSDEVALAAGATETARILLSSQTEREPNGVGNDADQVGRHLQAHVYGGAVGIFDEVVFDGLGPGPSISTCDFLHGNEGIIGGGMLANEFVTTPVSAFDFLTSTGLLPVHGRKSKEGMREMFPRLQRVNGPIQEMTRADSRVTLDPHVVDSFGNPVVRLSGGVHREDVKAQSFLSDRAEEWLRASGARHVARLGARSLEGVPSSGQHQVGTCRMGTDPARSVTDPVGRVWGHANVRVVDGSTHVTNAGLNPVLTIFANAFRISDDMVT